jgi:hypothetical protein
MEETSDEDLEVHGKIDTIGIDHIIILEEILVNLIS